MNVNFKPSISQGKSLRFLKSNDGKKTLLKPVNINLPTNLFPTQNLIAFWKLDNLTDSSSNGNNLVNLGNVQFVSGKIGNCAEFNGSNRLRGASGVVLNTAQDFTISFWANPSANVNSSIIAGIDSGIIFRIRSLSDGSLRFDGTGGTLDVVNALTVGTWKHYVCINAGGRTKIYINGSEVYNQVSTFSFTNTTTQIGIGDMPNFFPDPFQGKIDAVGIWQRELTQSEIGILYNEGNGREP